MSISAFHGGLQWL